MVSEEFSRAFLEGGDPIGRRLRRLATVPLDHDRRRRRGRAPRAAAPHRHRAGVSAGRADELYPVRLAEFAVRSDVHRCSLAPAMHQMRLGHRSETSR